MSEDNFFAVAPADSAEDAPIVLGGPPEGDDFGGDFAVVPEQEPSYLGEVDESTPIVMMPPADESDAPIILGGGSAEADEPAEPTGPTPMQKWNEGWQETLKLRKDEENAMKAEMIESARLAMEKFTAERDAKREAKMATNREDEQVKLEAIEADLENDNSWQRVCKMVELSHDSTKEAKDVKRMRDTLILLKNEPARAQALGA